MDFPRQPAALGLYVRANHYLNVADRPQFQKGIYLLEQVLKLEPDNHYVQAELLIAYHVQQAISPDQALNQDRMLVLSEQLQQVSYSPQAVVQPRIYEALALQATVENQVETATHYLAQAQVCGNRCFHMCCKASMLNSKAIWMAQAMPTVKRFIWTHRWKLICCAKTWCSTLT